jgi:hypothetical protein
MPMLSLLLFLPVIMFLPPSTTKVIQWQRLPPMKPPEVQICKPFIHEWNQGLHGVVNRHRVTQYYFRKQRRLAGTNTATVPSDIPKEATARTPLTVKAKARTSLNVKAASTPKELPAWTQLDVNAASTSKEYSARTTFDVTAHSSHHYDDKTRAASVATVTSHKHTLANTQLALLYSLSTLGSLMAYQFDSDTERGVITSFHCAI